MIIDTKGFEIGDEVWVVFHSVMTGEKTPIPFIIKGFKFYKDKFILINDYSVECNSKNIYKTEQDCQLECDRLNGVSYD